MQIENWKLKIFNWRQKGAEEEEDEDEEAEAERRQGFN